MSLLCLHRPMQNKGIFGRTWELISASPRPKIEGCICSRERKWNNNSAKTDKLKTNVLIFRLKCFMIDLQILLNWLINCLSSDGFAQASANTALDQSALAFYCVWCIKYNDMARAGAWKPLEMSLNKKALFRALGKLLKNQNEWKYSKSAIMYHITMNTLLSWFEHFFIELRKFFENISECYFEQ